MSKASGGARRGGAGRGHGDSDDVLARLARLGDAPPAVEEAAPTLPPIVEAEPTFPPLERPSELPPEDPEPAAVARPDAAEVVELTSSSPASLSASTLTTSVVAPVMAPVALVVPDPSLPTDSAVSTATVTALAPAIEPNAADQSPASAAALLDPPAPVTDLAPAPVVPVVPVEVPVVAVPEAAPSEAPNEPGADASPTGGVTLPLRRLKAPLVFRRAKPRVRRVTRVVRHVDTWSVFKVALVFNVVLYLCCLTSGVLLWNVAHATGTIDNVEKFFEQFGWERFEFKGGEIYHNAWIAGMFVAVGLTGFAVLLATVFNLITDLVGGIRVSVLEEEVVARDERGTNPNRMAVLSRLERFGRGGR